MRNLRNLRNVFYNMIMDVVAIHAKLAKRVLRDHTYILMIVRVAKHAKLAKCILYYEDDHSCDTCETCETHFMISYDDDGQSY